MKKILLICMALTLALLFASCGGKTKNTDSSTAAPADSTEATQPDATEATLPDQTEAPASTEENASESAAQPTAALLPGELYQLENTDTPVLRGVSLSGNRSGSAEFNSAEPATEGIRCIFELSEWIEVTLDTDSQDEIEVWAFTHNDDPEAYRSFAFSDETPGFAAFCELLFDPEAEPGASRRGSFYLNPDECEAGYYDLVFTVNGKATAVLQTRFYAEGELEAKTDAELTQLMSAF